MQINDYLKFTTFSLFAFAVIFIGLPVSIYLLKKGLEGFIKYRFSKMPKKFLIVPGYGNYSIEVIFYGLFLLVFSIWFLFFDKGGQLINYVKQIRSFF